MVNIKTIDAKVLSRMFLAGAKNLEAKKEWINELNVFPVPDGDTGTNMTMTIMSAAAEVSALTEPDMETSGKSHFFRFSSWCPWKLWCNSFPVTSRIHQGSQKIQRTGCHYNRCCHGTCSRNSIQSCYETKRRNHPYCSKRSRSQSCRNCSGSRRTGTFFQRNILNMQNILFPAHRKCFRY